MANWNFRNGLLCIVSAHGVTSDCAPLVVPDNVWVVRMCNDQVCSGAPGVDHLLNAWVEHQRGQGPLVGRSMSCVFEWLCKGWSAQGRMNPTYEWAARYFRENTCVWGPGSSLYDIVFSPETSRDATGRSLRGWISYLTYINHGASLGSGQVNRYRWTPQREDESFRLSDILNSIPNADRSGLPTPSDTGITLGRELKDRDQPLVIFVVTCANSTCHPNARDLNPGRTPSLGTSLGYTRADVQDSSCSESAGSDIFTPASIAGLFGTATTGPTLSTAPPTTTAATGPPGSLFPIAPPAAAAAQVNPFATPTAPVNLFAALTAPTAPTAPAPVNPFAALTAPTAPTASTAPTQVNPFAALTASTAPTTPVNPFAVPQQTTSTALPVGAATGSVPPVNPFAPLAAPATAAATVTPVAHVAPVTTAAADTYSRDSSPMCSEWARTGECYKNPQYMLNNCRPSCLPQLSDKDENCPTWAARGECQANPGYMSENCLRSCVANSGQINYLYRYYKYKSKYMALKRQLDLLNLIVDDSEDEWSQESDGDLGKSSEEVSEEG